MDSMLPVIANYTGCCLWPFDATAFNKSHQTNMPGGPRPRGISVTASGLPAGWQNATICHNSFVRRIQASVSEALPRFRSDQSSRTERRS